MAWNWSRYRPRRYGRMRRYGGYRSRRRRTTYTRPSRPRRSAPTKKRRKNVLTANAPSQNLTAGERFVLAQIEPFDSNALGCKWPDANTVPSVATTHTQLQQFSFTTSVAQKCMAFLPSLAWSIVEATQGTSGWTWPAAYGGTTAWTDNAAYTQALDSRRPCSHAIRLSCPLAPTSATGFVHCAIAFPNCYQQTTWPLPVNVGEISKYPHYTRVTLASLTQSPLTVINKFVDQTASRYTAVNSNESEQQGKGEFQIPNQWGVLLVAVEGSPSGQLVPLEIEMILHQEGIVRQNSFLMGNAAAPFVPSQLGAASAAASNTQFTHTEDQQTGYIAQALEAAREGAAQAGDVAMNRVVIPAARQAGYTATGAALSAGIALAGRALGVAGVNDNANRLALTR